MTPMSVSVLGWIRIATHALMIARSGNIQIAPMRPVNVRGPAAPPLDGRGPADERGSAVVVGVIGAAGCRIIEGSDNEEIPVVACADYGRRGKRRRAAPGAGWSGPHAAGCSPHSRYGAS